MAIPFVGPIVAFLVALLVGGLAIYISASVIADVQNYRHAVVTAIVGAIGWAVVSWIPLVGTVLALIVWVWIINWRYPGGWKDAALIGLIAWISALVVLAVVNTVFRIGIGAFGVPGV